MLDLAPAVEITLPIQNCQRKRGLLMSALFILQPRTRHPAIVHVIGKTSEVEVIECEDQTALVRHLDKLSLPIFLRSDVLIRHLDKSLTVVEPALFVVIARTHESGDFRLSVCCFPDCFRDYFHDSLSGVLSPCTIDFRYFKFADKWPTNLCDNSFHKSSVVLRHILLRNRRLLTGLVSELWRETFVCLMERLRQLGSLFVRHRRRPKSFFLILDMRPSGCLKTMPSMSTAAR